MATPWQKLSQVQGKNEVYSCGRYCGHCSHALHNAPGFPNRDGARCAGTLNEKLQCGHQEQIIEEDCNDIYAVCHAGLACVSDACDQCKTLYGYTCANDIPEGKSEHPDYMYTLNNFLCCAECSITCDTFNDFLCQYIRDAEDTCAHVSKEKIIYQTNINRGIPHTKSHRNSRLMSINRMNKDNLKYGSNIDFHIPERTNCVLLIQDCLELLKHMPDESVQLILLDPPYNLDLAAWDTYDNYIQQAAQWIDEAYRVLSKNGNMVVFGGTQFQNVRSGDLIEIIYYCRHHTQWRLVNTIIWHYKNGMSAHRYFANRHEELIWLTKTDNYYFDLDSVRVPYSPKELELALGGKRLIPENVMKGKNPTNVQEIGRLNGNSLERVGHPTQKPLEIIRRCVQSLSYSDSIVLDFFAGSGTTGRVSIEEKRNCILCDQNPESIHYFNKHIDNMNKTELAQPFSMDSSLEEFFEHIQKRRG